MTKQEARCLLNKRAIYLPVKTIELLKRLVDLIRVPDIRTSDIEGFTACPTIMNLALRLRVSERQVTDMIAQLRDAGLVSVAFNAGRIRQNVYSLNVTSLKKCPLLVDVRKEAVMKRKQQTAERNRKYRERLRKSSVDVELLYEDYGLDGLPAYGG